MRRNISPCSILPRTELLLGHPAKEALKHARVAVFGIGGVGGYACEAPSGGVGADLIDDDKVCLTNINRQSSPRGGPSASIRPTSCATVYRHQSAGRYPRTPLLLPAGKRRRVPVFGI
ncbi:MAG: ThiF family adenylyltransferase [Oscillospiraceae bacterium]